ncbi:MAG: hypothetical protein JW955_04040 [Sedimentisphaerales bacterium]|nr:hypothetical protein [Sedimentisphaerales bacterium]
MSALPNDEYASKVRDIADRVESTGASAYYDPDGDCIEFLARAEEFWAERIDDLVTVYYSEQSGDVIGSLIKGVSRFIKEHPNLAIFVEAGRVRLSHLFLAGLLCDQSNQQDVEVVTYKKKQQVYKELFERAEETQAETTMTIG